MTLLGRLTNPPDVDDVTAFWFSKIVPNVNDMTNMAVFVWNSSQYHYITVQ